MYQSRNLTMVVLVVAAAMGGYRALAQDEPAGPPEGSREGNPPMMEPMGPMMDDQAMPPSPQDRPMMQLRALNQALNEVQLTDPQKQQIQDIRKEHRQQMDQWRKDHETELKDLKQKMEDARKEHKPQMERGRELWQKVRGLLESDVKGADLEQQVIQLRQQYKQLQQDREQAKEQMKPLHEQMQKLMATAPPAQPVVDKILNILTAEQRPVVEKRMKEIEAQGPGMGGPGAPGMMGPGPGNGHDRMDRGDWGKGGKEGHRSGDKNGPNGEE